MRFPIVVLISIFAMVAFAKTASDCHTELKNMCQDKQGSAKFDCMKAGVDKLDAECKTLITAGKEKFMAAHEFPCAADRDKCKEAGFDHEKMMKCFFEKRAELTDNCKKHLDDRLKERPCLEDRYHLCGDIPTGGGKVYECLKKNTDKLTAACKDKLGKSKKADFDKPN